MNAKDVDRSLKDIQSQKCPFMDGVIGHHTLSRPIVFVISYEDFPRHSLFELLIVICMKYCFFFLLYL